MSILLSGDFHAGQRGELSVISRKALRKKLTKPNYDNIQYHIMLGDAGWKWSKESHKTDLYHLNILYERGFPIYCVFGNHENYDAIMECPLVDTGLGNDVYQVYENVFYFQRGKVYKIEGWDYLILDGGLSIDKMWRKEGISWWPQEYWTDLQKIELMNYLKENNKFEFILSHTGPNSICRNLCVGMPGMKDKFFDDTAIFFDDVLRSGIIFDTWFMGHWHQEQDWLHPYTKQRFTCLYEKVYLIDDGNVRGPF